MDAPSNRYSGLILTVLRSGLYRIALVSGPVVGEPSSAEDSMRRAVLTRQRIVRTFRLGNLPLRVLSKTTPKAVVLRFDVSRDKLADLEALVFTNENCGFWPFVTYCRSGSVPHGRSTGRQMEYDIVYGPVSIWPQRLVIKDCDQVSFHTVTALNVIPTLSVAITGNPYF